MIQLYNGDCLELMRDIPDGSVDLIVTDPPYGTMKGAALDGWKANTTYWDVAICVDDLLQHCGRILRPNGKAVVFSQGAYTAELMTKAPPMLPFCYRAIWRKDHFANSLSAKKAMVSPYEDICIFSKVAPKHDFDGGNPLREYFREVLKHIGPDEKNARKRVLSTIGGRADHTTRVNSTQFALCTEAVYNELRERFELDDMPGFVEYGELRRQEDEYRTALIDRMNAEAPSVFNLWQGGKYKSNVLEYPKDYGGLHPTQKPVALIEDLVQTFSNPGDVVIDCCMGSGTTGVACVNTGRRFIGIELDAGYFEIAQKRIEEARSQIKMEVDGE